MKALIFAEPRFEITISKTLMELLLLLSREHYDGVCQKASSVGGFLYGWNNAMEFESSYDLTSRELDLTTKIIENLPSNLGEPERKEIDEYRRFVARLFKERESFSQYQIELIA